MATLSLRDRDAIVTKEGLIFRVLGYDHPPDAYICDLEYAPKTIFISNNPRALRGCPQATHYKLYEDEAWTYLKKRYPQYLIWHEMLQRKVVGVRGCDIVQVRRPQDKLKELLEKSEKDRLVTAMANMVDIVIERSGLRHEDFGVFGSMLHGFHHPELSDIDITVYGKEKINKLCMALGELDADASSPLRNEFETDQTTRGKRWRFRNLSPQEYVWHQRRKMIYALFKDKRRSRTIKTEFEPVKNTSEISSRHACETRILSLGWVKMTARVTRSSEAPFIPSVYAIKPIDVLEGPKQAAKARHILSYIEEFRLQVKSGEKIYVEGNIEEARSHSHNFFQVMLTHCPRYYEQVLKCRNPP